MTDKSNAHVASESDGNGLLHKRSELLAAIYAANEACAEEKRLIVGISGAPASGKSTLAQWLVDRINAESEAHAPAVVVPMDGFHLDNAVLSERNMLAVKGAPETFDVLGFLSLLQRLAAPLCVQSDSASAGASTTIHIPVFDRRMDLARCAAASVTAQHRIAIVEGNYLLLKRSIWRDVSALIDLSVLLDVPLSVLEERLIQRWLDFGLPVEAARERAQSNDIPNAKVVICESSRPQLSLTQVVP